MGSLLNVRTIYSVTIAVVISGCLIAFQNCGKAFDTKSTEEFAQPKSTTEVSSSPPAPAPSPSPQPAATRDPLKQPFASTSIWNMPIGSAAVYVPANIPNYEGTTEWTPMPGIDEERIVLRPTAPLISINYSDASWSDRDRCVATGGELAKVPVPSNFIISGEHYTNSSASFLMPDKRTIVQTQPFARCTTGGPGTSLVRFPDVDLYGDGRSGAHGATMLSAIGGSIRLGELRPGSQGPKHVLKVNVSAKAALYKCSTASDCFRWPAYSADNYAVGFYGTATNNSNTAMKMGALLAIPKSVDLSSLGLQTEPAKQLAWTLQNYGAYIVDDTYGPGFAFNIEDGPDGSLKKQFKADYGFDFERYLGAGITPDPWMRDIQRLIKALYVVNNNGPTTIGGGGTPLQTLAPPLTAP